MSVISSLSPLGLCVAKKQPINVPPPPPERLETGNSSFSAPVDIDRLFSKLSSGPDKSSLFIEPSRTLTMLTAVVKGCRPTDLLRASGTT